MSARPDPFAQFVGSLANLSAAEARKAKLLYLRNALVSYSIYIADARAFGLVQIGLVAIPIFWPILFAQRRSMVNGARKQRALIANALDLWAAELGDDALGLRRELDQLARGAPRMLPWRRKQPPQLMDRSSP